MKCCKVMGADHHTNAAPPRIPTTFGCSGLVLTADAAPHAPHLRGYTDTSEAEPSDQGNFAC